MKDSIKAILSEAIERMLEKGAFTASVPLPDWLLETPREEKYGDFAANCAMQFASVFKTSPKRIANEIISNIEDSEGLLEKVEIAGAGFINITVSAKGWRKALGAILAGGDEFGKNNSGGGRRVMVEFISANPTGPLHIGHGRGAIVGDVIARILDWNGYSVYREFYVNDAGAQVVNFAKSLYARYREHLGLTGEIPPDGYLGDYVKEMAAEIYREIGDKYADSLSDEAFIFFRDEGLKRCLKIIKEDVALFGVKFDEYFSEAYLHASGKVKEAVEALLEKGYIYEKDGALWFRSSEEGDEKDRVLYKSDGTHTYLASDIAYHKNKLDRGFDWLINIWGADHHGYIARVNGAIKALSGRDDALEVVLVQMVNILKDGEPIKSSKRAGTFETLRDLIQEVGADAARFYFIMRAANAPLDFDIELAKKKSQDNPVYYVQYGHARCASILKKARETGYEPPPFTEDGVQALELKEEFELVKKLLEFPETVESAGKKLAPHSIVYYLTETIALFHSYYTKYKDSEKIVSDDAGKTNARLLLTLALKQVLSNGLSLLGVSAPESM
ncbi:MAG: arginine--tRNA ligase [Myxococcota bacterium]